jgi:alpha-L-fucosidase
MDVLLQVPISLPEGRIFMRWRPVITAAMAVVAFGLSGPVMAEAPSSQASVSHIPALDSPQMQWWRDSMKSHDQRMQWWRKARFGMFIHWGVYSELGGAWQGKNVDGYAEHIMRKDRIPISVYKSEVVGKFDPVKFNADSWVKLAKDAGIGYIVITSKHHDGFAMYDSDVTDYNVVKATPWHHDPMKDLKVATQKQGLHFGFYYSQAWDWADPNGTGNDWDYDRPAGDRGLHGGKLWWEHDPAQVAQVEKYVHGKAIPQLQELIAKYDPDIFWFDTNSKMPPGLNLEVFKAVRLADPTVIINSRCVSHLGDYLSTADRPAEFAPHDGDWEGIPTTNDSYGYKIADRSHKPPEFFIRLIAKAAARGGNLMLNIGPRGDGTIDPPDVAILQGIGRWMKINGDSIHGTDRTPLTVQSWGESTRKGKTLYLHVFDWPTDGNLVVGGLKSNVSKAYLLSDTTRAPLKVSRISDLDVRIAVPPAAPDKIDAVVVVECQGGDIAVDSNRLLSASQSNTLRVFDGKLEGKTISFGQGKKQNAYIEHWSNPDDSISWPLRVDKPTTFDLSAVYDAPAPSAGGKFNVTIASKTFPATVKKGTEQTQHLGQLHLDPGNYELKVTPEKIDGEELMNLRSITLNPTQTNNTAARRGN